MCFQYFPRVVPPAFVSCQINEGFDRADNEENFNECKIIAWEQESLMKKLQKHGLLGCLFFTLRIKHNNFACAVATLFFYLRANLIFAFWTFSFALLIRYLEGSATYFREDILLQTRTALKCKLVNQSFKSFFIS